MAEIKRTEANEINVWVQTTSGEDWQVNYRPANFMNHYFECCRFIVSILLLLLLYPATISSLRQEIIIPPLFEVRTNKAFPSRQQTNISLSYEPFADNNSTFATQQPHQQRTTTYNNTHNNTTTRMSDRIKLCFFSIGDQLLMKG